MPGTARLTRDERIARRAAFVAARTEGVRLEAPHYLAYARRVAGDARRLGVTASARVGNAVARNRVKRMIREVYRRHKELVPRGRELVIVARPGAVGLDYARVERELRRLLERVP